MKSSLGTGGFETKWEYFLTLLEVSDEESSSSDT